MSCARVLGPSSGPAAGECVRLRGPCRRVSEGCAAGQREQEQAKGPLAKKSGLGTRCPSHSSP